MCGGDGIRFYDDDILVVVVGKRRRSNPCVCDERVEDNARNGKQFTNCVGWGKDCAITFY